MAVSPKHRLIVVLGPTGSGKSRQAKDLAGRHGFVYVSTGDLCRASNDPRVQDAMAKGDLPASELVNELVDTELRHIAPDQVVVIDGYPRLIDELEWLDSTWPELMQGLVVIEIKVSREVSYERSEYRHRSDDSSALVDRKWDWYERDTARVLSEAARRGVLQAVDGAGTPEEVAGLIEKALA